LRLTSRAVVFVPVYQRAFLLARRKRKSVQRTQQLPGTPATSAGLT
jgi:hypothetical protein